MLNAAFTANGCNGRCKVTINACGDSGGELTVLLPLLLVQLVEPAERVELLPLLVERQRGVFQIGDRVFQVGDQRPLIGHRTGKTGHNRQIPDGVEQRDQVPKQADADHTARNLAP